MAKVETVLVAFNSTEKDETSILLVGKQLPDKPTEIINSFQGKDAIELYNKLITKTELMGK